MAWKPPNTDEEIFSPPSGDEIISDEIKSDNPIINATLSGLTQSGFGAIEAGFRSDPKKVADILTETSLLPTAGAIGGGLAGSGVASIPLAGLGGAFGESLRQIGQRIRGSENAPATSLEALKGIGIEGATSAAGEGIGRAAIAAVKTLAVPAARRALGVTSKYLNEAFSRADANRAAKIALEKDIIPLLGSPEEAFRRASDLAKSTGNKIGNILKKIEFEKIAPDAELEIGLLKQKLTKGTEKGLLAGAIPVIDDVKATILELYGRGLTAAEYNTAKNNLAGSLNYFADAASQRVNKRVVDNMANSIRSSVKKLLPDSFDEFVKNQKLYHAAAFMKRALNGELARQMGNRAGSLAAVATGASQLASDNIPGASGNIPGAAVSAGIVEALQRRGAGTTARTIQGIQRNPFTATAPAQLIGQAITSGLGFGQKRKKE